MRYRRPWGLPITKEQVTARLAYDPEVGSFAWRDKPNERAGCVDNEGYLRIGLNGSDYHAHKLAWLISKGVLPSEMIDHINGDKTDNRITNLRVVTTAQNSWNRRVASHNTSGATGVHFDKCANKWRARICAYGKRQNLGLFSSRADAIAARIAAEQEIYSEFAPAHNVAQAAAT